LSVWSPKISITVENDSHLLHRISWGCHTTKGGDLILRQKLTNEDILVYPERICAGFVSTSIARIALAAMQRGIRLSGKAFGVAKNPR